MPACSASSHERVETIPTRPGARGVGRGRRFRRGPGLANVLPHSPPSTGPWPGSSSKKPSLVERFLSKTAAWETRPRPATAFPSIPFRLMAAHRHSIVRRTVRDSIGVLAVCVLVLAGCPDARAQQIAATVDSTASVIDYTGSAPLHNWTGTSRNVAGRFVLDPNHADSSRASIQVPVATFDSGNDRRDRKMREVTDAEEYPLVRFRATDIRPLRWGRTDDGRAGRWRATGTLTFHGQTHSIDAPVRVRVGEDSVYARAQFAISLTRFEVERPSLLWASIGDTIRIDARIKGPIEEPSSAVRQGSPSPSAVTETPLDATSASRRASRSVDLPAEQFRGGISAPILTCGAVLSSHPPLECPTRTTGTSPSRTTPSSATVRARPSWDGTDRSTGSAGPASTARRSLRPSSTPTTAGTFKSGRWGTSRWSGGTSPTRTCWRPPSRRTPGCSG